MRAIELERAELAQQMADKIKQIRAAEVQGVKDAEAAKLGVEKDTALARKAILEDLQKTAADKARAALEAYKSYAQQVIALDKSIALNRLDTAASLHALNREDMSPKEQAQDIKDEMGENQRASNAAWKSGDKQAALDLLNRNRALANQLAHVKGDGIDAAAQKEEGKAALEDIGRQADAILRAQQEEARKAAEEQKALYQEMTASVGRLAGEIRALNQSLAVQLKVDVEGASLSAMREKIQAALKEPFQVGVQGSVAGAQGTEKPSVGAGLPAIGAKIAGKPAPASEPSLAQKAVAPIVAGQAQRDAWKSGANAWGDGKGGLAPGIERMQPMTLDMGALGRVRMMSTRDTAADVADVIRTHADIFGSP